MRVKSQLLLLAWMLAIERTSVADDCLYGLYATTGNCQNVQQVALERVASAKTICYSANSNIQWNKNNKQPVGAFTSMRAGARIAMKGFTPLYSCERSDLVIKIDYDETSLEFAQVTLAVTDAESGDAVFREQRSISDLSSDLTRMATHFQNMRSDALAAQVAEAADIQAKAKRKAFFAHLPRHWKNQEGLAVDVWVTDGVLYENSTQTTTDSIKIETSCEVKQGADEVTPWTGYCTHKFVWSRSRPACEVQTHETVATIRGREISGRSQVLNTAPLKQTPSMCPVPSSESRDFSLTPGDEQTSE